MFSPTHAYIDLQALCNNLEKIKAEAPKSKVLAMVKSNAYGHGAVPVAKALEPKVDAFGVMFLKEALELIEAGIRKPLVIITGFLNREELKVINYFKIETVIHNFEQIAILEKCHLENPQKIWLKIDTGMHRLGFQCDHVKEAYQRLSESPNVVKPFRFLTHFSDADNIFDDKTARQLACFEKALAGFEGEWCMANSAAIFNWPKTHYDWIRPGLSLYGSSPVKGQTGLDLALEPVMTLASRIITIHDLEAGEAVGYGSTFRCPKKMRVGTVAIGYGDGYPRNTKEAPVLVDGIKTRMIGRVAMDMIGVDLDSVPNAKIGSEVILWGRNLPVEKIAACAGEISYELFCRLTSRVKYVYE